MNINKNFTTVNFNYGYGKRNDYIVIHYTAGNNDTASGNAAYFKSVNRNASAHYFVDQTSIWQIVADDNISWHCGGGLQGSGGHSFFGMCTNNNSIGIEMCSVKSGSGHYDYMIPEKTVENTLELTRMLMKKYNIPASRVIRHFDVTGKICPAPFVNNEQLWIDFKNKLVNGDELTMAQYEELKGMIAELTKAVNKLENKMIYNYIDKNMPDWARPTIQKLVDKKLLLGNEKGELGLTEEMLKIYVTNDRAGLYD